MRVDLPEEEGVLTADPRPIGEATSNRGGPARPEADGVDPTVRRALAASGAWLTRPPAPSQRVAAPVEEAEGGSEVLVQIASVFAYAMIGAVVFHLGWWLLTG